MTQLKPHIALIGCGRWGQYILRDLKLLNCKVSVVCRSKESVARAEQFSADTILSHIDQLQQNLDGIIIATPTRSHYQMIKDLAYLDIPILVEKTAGLHLHEVESLLPMQAKLFVTSKFHYHNGISKLKELVHNNQFGELIGLQSCCQRWGVDQSDIDVLSILLPHELAIFREILGYTAEFKSAKLRQWQVNFIDATISFNNGIWVDCHINTFSPSPRREIKLIFKEHVALLSGINSTEITIYPNEANSRIMEKITFSPNQPLFEEIKTFINFLKGGEKPGCTILDNIEQLKIITEINAYLEKDKA